jgi:MbtH protein
MSEAEKQYKVVRNDQNQYSIWFSDMNIPAGWQEAGKEGSKQECLDYIEEVWTDMRPSTLQDS